jgi:hypothetical protein
MPSGKGVLTGLPRPGPHPSQRQSLFLLLKDPILPLAAFTLASPSCPGMGKRRAPCGSGSGAITDRYMEGQAPRLGRLNSKFCCSKSSRKGGGAVDEVLKSKRVPSRRERPAWRRICTELAKCRLGSWPAQIQQGNPLAEQNKGDPAVAVQMQVARVWIAEPVSAGLEHK